jgi:hypothetical protein
MALLDDIIEAATDDKVPIGTLLRRCLVLEHQVKNEKFKKWLDRELDGYDNDSEVPSYRTLVCVNRGDFLGLTVRMPNQPISLHIMEERDRKLVERCVLHQPAASYEARPDKSSDAQMPWPPFLTAKYAQKVYEGGEPTLHRAWQVLPGSFLVALSEQVRTRVLRFALELKDNLPKDSVDATTVPADVVEKSVVTNIFGGKAIDWT